MLYEIAFFEGLASKSGFIGRILKAFLALKLQEYWKKENCNLFPSNAKK